MAKHTNMIAALLRERDGYKAQGKPDRVRQVDEQLEHYGYSPEPDQADGPQGRTAPPQKTADADPGRGTGDGTAKAAAPAKKTAAKKTAAVPPPATPPAE